jgi:hypothetical protein
MMRASNVKGGKMSKKLFILFAFVSTFSGFSSISSASNPITPGVVDSGTARDYSNVVIDGKEWKDVTAAELVDLLNAKIKEQGNNVTAPVNASGTTPVTTSSDTAAPIITSGVKTMGSNPIPPPTTTTFMGSNPIPPGKTAGTSIR